MLGVVRHIVAKLQETGRKINIQHSAGPVFYVYFLSATRHRAFGFEAAADAHRFGREFGPVDR